MSNKKVIALFLFAAGLALLGAALYFWLEPPKDGGVLLTAGQIFAFLLGAGASLKGWRDFFKPEKPAPATDIHPTGDQPQIATGPNGRNIQVQAGDYVEGDKHIHLPPEPPETHDSLGSIPPVKAVTYVHRGSIETEVEDFLRAGNGVGAIVGLHAPGGLGKTELAKHAADELKGQFEDILWVDVGEKTPPQVVAEMLVKCGVQTQPGASYQQQKTELCHYLQGRRLLVILDDLRKAALDGLADFLPPKPCAALITSRIQQIGGVNKTFELDHLTQEQARELLEAILGLDVVAAESAAAEKLFQRCAGNPLALEIAARRIRQMRGLKNPILQYFELAQARFGELKMDGDARWDMNKIFDISYLDLTPADQQRFRALAAFAPTGFAPEAAACVWGQDPGTDLALSRLTNLSLVKVVDGEMRRYRLHDLLDEYAAPKLAASGEENAARDALAEWIVNLFQEHHTDDKSTAPQAAAERANLLRSCEWARGQKNGALLAWLVTKSRNWFYVSFTEDWLYWIAWLEACLQLGFSDDQLRADVLKAIGDVQQFRDERDAALASYHEALKLFRAVGDHLGEANVLQAIGDVQQFRDERDAALASYHEALKLFRAVGAKLGEANVLKAIGDVQQFRDGRDAALASYHEALKLFRAVGAKLGEANVLKAIGDVQQFRKEMDAALASYHEALKLFRAVGAKLGEANVLKAIGDVQQFRKEMDAALASYHEALKLFRAVGTKLGEADVLKAIGDVQQFRDERDAALASYHEALKLFRAVGAKLGEANVLKAIGDVQQFRDGRDAALASYHEALKLFRAVGTKLGEANVLKAIGDVQQFRKEMDAALASYHEALKLFRAVGDHLGEANVLKAIGDVQQFRDGRDAALASYHEALKLFRAVGDHLGEANVLKAIGDVQQFRKEMDAALASYHEALKLFRAVGDHLGEANVLKAIGDVQQFRKEMDAALASYHEALKLFRAVGAKLGEANVLQAIGDVQQFRDERDAALASYHEALKLFRAMGAKLGEANVLAAQTRLALGSGDLEAAEKQMEQVVAMRRAIGDLYNEGADYGNFAIVLLNLGQKEKAKEYALKARAIFGKIQLPAIVEMMDNVIKASEAETGDQAG